MIAICTAMGTPQRCCELRAAAYQPSCSRKMLHTLAGSLGGVVAQLARPNTVPSAHGR